MDSLWNMDAFTSTRNNPRTGQAERKWIEYADGLFEPVRKNGDLNKKYHGNKRELDWWTVDKPLDWDPAGEGRQVTLDHDYRMPGTGRKANPKAVPSGIVKFEDIGKGGQPSVLRDKDRVNPVPAVLESNRKPQQQDKSAPRSDSPARPQGGEETRPAPKTTLLRGAAAYHEFEAERQAEKDARAKGSPHPAASGSGKLAGADSAPPPKADDNDGKSDAAATGAGAAGGMVKPRGQHGEGPASGNDQRINDFQRKYEAADAQKKGSLKNEFKKEIDELKAKAKKANGKERKKLLRRAEQWKGALKVLTDGKIRPVGPVMLFNVPLMKKMLDNPAIDPTTQDKT